MTKKLLGNYPCPHPDCDSSDAYQVWEKDGYKDAHCFRCSYHVPRLPKGLSAPYNALIGDDSGQRYSEEPRALMRPSKAATSAFSTGAPNLPIEDGLAHPVREIKLRCISYSTAEHFGVRVGVSTTDGETPIYYLFPRYRNGSLVGWKTKSPDKQFSISGGNDVDLFGQWCAKPSGKKIWITEGEIDALSVYQVLKENSTLQGWEPPVVSIPDGCQSATKALARAAELLEGYEEIVIVFDNDEAGRLARDEACKVFAGKVSYVDLPFKDPNEMLVLGKGVELKWQCLTHSKKYQPDGVVNARDLWARYKTVEDAHFYPWPSSMPELQRKTLGIQLGTVITITSGTGSGKSQFLREVLFHLFLHTNEKIAGMFLEEDAGETIGSLISLDLNKRINLPNVSVPEEVEKASFDKLFSSGRISLYDFFGGMDDSTLLSKLRYFAVTGHKFIFLDHLSIVISEFATEGDERKKIDVLMSKLAKFAKEFKVTIFNVVHLKKAEFGSASFELGTVPTLDDLRGSASLKHLSWVVLALSRNQQHEDEECANTTELNVLKCRLTGDTGTSGYLKFDRGTGRMLETELPINYRPKKGRAA